MSAAALLRRLDRLDHRERLAALVQHVRSDPAAAAALQAELSSGDTHARKLGLFVAGLRRDPGPAFAALTDPSVSVRGQAAAWIGHHADAIDPAVVDRIDSATFTTLARHLVRRRLPEVIEPIVDALRARYRVRDAALLLSACSQAYVAAAVDDAAWPHPTWPRLARYRTSVMIEIITRAFAEDPERPDLVWRRFSPFVWQAIARRAPQAVADWVDAYADPEQLPPSLGAALPDLVRFSPARVVGWLVARPSWLLRHGLPRGLARRATTLPDATLVPMAVELARGAPAALAQLLAPLPYPQRAALFEAAVQPLATERIEWPTALLAVLPERLRDREAARMLGLRRAREQGAWRRELLGFRAIEHAREALQEEGRAAQAVERGEAHAALVRSTGRSRRGMAETLAWLQRIANEQDPVRLAVLSALAELPGHVYDDPTGLEAVVAPIFDARDTSYPTRGAVARLAQRIMVAQATTPRSPMFRWAIDLLTRLAGQGGTPDLPVLHPNLPRGAEQGIVDALMPWLDAARQRQLEGGIFRLWYALGERAWRVPALGELIERVMWSGHKSNATHAANLWLADPKARDARVCKLVDRDRSALWLPMVFSHCDRRRQSLLWDRFAPKAVRGRFHDGKVQIIPVVRRGVPTWTPGLQRALLEMVSRAERESKRQAWSRAGLVALRARIPLTTVEDLRYAWDATDVVAQEAGLGALVWIDQPAPALPILLEHLDSDRARVAMYAVPRLARLVAADEVVDALAGVLARPKLKVTVHKEVLRLLGQYPTERATALLVQAWSQPLHRDVRIAALHAARAVLGRPEAWTLAAEAAADASADVARALVEVPRDNVALAHRRRYLELMTRVADHAEPAARAALFAALRAGWADAAPTMAVQVAAKVIGRLDPVDPWRAALTVLGDGARSPRAHDAIVALIESLLRAAAEDLEPAGERDQLPYQRLLAVVGELSARRGPAPAAVLQRVAAVLLAMPLSWSAAVEARVAATPNDELASAVQSLISAAPSARAVSSIEHRAREAAGETARAWEDDAAGQVVDALAGGDAPARVVAVAMLEPFGVRFAWGTRWSERLRAFRRDPDLDVATAARNVFIARA